MKRSSFLRLTALGILLLQTSAFAAEDTPPPEPTPAPAVDPAKVYSPTDLDALRPMLGQPVIIEGTLVASGESKSKTVRYLNFTKNYHESVGLVFFTSKGGDDFALEKLSAWVGKKVRVTGKLGDHSGSLQIEIEKVDQIQEVP